MNILGQPIFTQVDFRELHPSGRKRIDTGYRPFRTHRDRFLPSFACKPLQMHFRSILNTSPCHAIIHRKPNSMRLGISHHSIH